jgi:hypothetical protein
MAPGKSLPLFCDLNGDVAAKNACVRRIETEAKIPVYERWILIKRILDG